MKREQVVPDLLASITADALFAGVARPNGTATPARKQASVFSPGRWFKSAPDQKTVATKPPGKGPIAPLTLDDDWVGGWYARTRLLQAATLANLPEGTAPVAHTGPGTTKTPNDAVDVLTQVKDFS
jgi:hypothetical protein